MRAIFRFKRVGNIAIELNIGKAPETVINFVSLIDKGFYDGVMIHRLAKDKIMQLGNIVKGKDRIFTRQQLDPEGNEFTIRNESNNGLSNVMWSVAMAREPYLPDSASAQFFINLADNTYLDYREGWPGYCVFGKVVGAGSHTTLGEINRWAPEDNSDGYPTKVITIEKAFME